MSEEEKQVVSEGKAKKKRSVEDKDKWVWSRIAEARRKHPNDTYRCWAESLQAIMESCLTGCLFIIENMVGIIFLLLGIIYLDDCPVNNAIPITLIVFGIFSLMHGICIQIVSSKCCDISDQKDGFATLAKVMLCITSFGTFFSFFFACFMVYGVYSRVTTKPEDKDSEHYCIYLLYWFSFIFVTIYLVLICILFILLCCLICFIAGAAMNETPPPHSVIIVHQTPKNDD